MSNEDAIYEAVREVRNAGGTWRTAAFAAKAAGKTSFVWLSTLSRWFNRETKRRSKMAKQLYDDATAKLIYDAVQQAKNAGRQWADVWATAKKFGYLSENVDSLKKWVGAYQKKHHPKAKPAKPAKPVTRPVLVPAKTPVKIEDANQTPFSIRTPYSLHETICDLTAKKKDLTAELAQIDLDLMSAVEALKGKSVN